MHLRFRYTTDEAFNGQGWYVDDISVGTFVDPVDTANGWTTNGWLFTTGLQNNDWTADAYVPYAKGGKAGYQVVPVVGLAGQGTTGSQVRVGAVPEELQGLRHRLQPPRTGPSRPSASSPSPRGSELI